MKCPKCQHENPADAAYCSRCAAPLPSFPGLTETAPAPLVRELVSGQTFAGRFQIIEELGHGGMGRVYKVFDTDIKEKIALKLLRPEIALDKETVERFSNELKLARKISHRNVCRMFDLGKAEGTTFITMEFVAGEDLKKFIRKSGQIGAGRAVSIGKQLCEGLAEAHHLGVVHRDLKPQNVMVDEDGNARIMDFGIARSLRGKGITGAGVMIGTPDYMSPEQVEGKDVDPRSDIYSLGIILYEMLTGRVPFDGDTPFTIGVKHKSEVPRDPRELNAQIPPDLGRLVLKCLEKDKAGRYQSASELRADLEKVERGLPTTERTVPKARGATSKEFTVTVKFRRWLVPVLAGVAMAIVALVLWRPFVHTPAGGISIAVLPFEDMSPQKDQAHICEGTMSAVITKLDRLGKLDIRSRFLSKPYGGTDKGPRTIGEELNVDHLLVGTVFFDRDSVRIDAELIRARDSTTLWRDSFSKRSEELFSVQSEIAERIAQALNVTLSPEEKAGLRKKPTDNVEAYKVYELGRWFFDKRTDEGLAKAEKNFQLAIGLDPGYALAYSGLADVYMFRFSQSEKEYGAKAKEAARKALELDDTLAEAHTSAANIKFDIDWDFKGAEVEFKTALGLDPNYATARHWYGRLLTILGRHEEALAEMERARDLNPTDLSINRNLGWSYLMARRTERAIEQLRNTFEMDPGFLLTKFMLAWAYNEKSMHQEVLDLCEDDHNDWNYQLALFRMGKLGTREEVLRRFDRVISGLDGYFAAAVYAELGGAADVVLKNLEKAFDDRDPNLLFVKVLPTFDEYLADPRYKALIKKMGLD